MINEGCELLGVCKPMTRKTERQERTWKLWKLKLDIQRTPVVDIHQVGFTNYATP